jgi:hypothetical protein
MPDDGFPMHKRCARPMNAWAWALALAAGLGMAALARADGDEVKPAETGNWFTRLFTRDGAKKRGTDKKDVRAELAPPSPALARQKAQWEWQRRIEVCEKLRQIAFETGDQELSRKADALDQRAWDVYVQRTGGSPSLLVPSNISPDEQILEGRLGLDAAQRAKGPSVAGAPPLGAAAGTATLDRRTAARKD